MKNEIQLFTNGLFGEVRAINVNGKVMFVGRDVASVLGYARPTKAIQDHCKGVLKWDIPTNGGVQEGSIITEHDVIRLIMKSKLPQAEAFEKWVVEEVVPKVLATGSYSIQTKMDSYMIEDPIKRAERWIEEQKQRKALEQEVKHKGEVIQGIVETLDKPTMRSRINQIVKYGANGGYAKRYGLLYGEFEKTQRVNLKKRLNNAIDRGELKKSAKYMDLICDHMDKTQELYKVAVRVFEGDLHKLGLDIVESTKREHLALSL